MITKKIELQEITMDELADKVADELLIKIKNYLNELHNNRNEAYLIRQEIADFSASFLQIKKPTFTKSS